MTKSRNNPWWSKVIHEQFVGHFFGMSRDEIADDILQSVKDLVSKNGEGNSFGAYLIRLSIERMEKNREIGTANGINGGRPKNNGNLPVKAPDQLTYGKMENVYLTQDEFNDLATQVGNLNEANSLIDNLSCKLADGSFQSDNHFATLCYWASYRKEKSEQQSGPIQSRYETVGEHNMRVMNEIFHRIDSQKKERENGRLG